MHSPDLSVEDDYKTYSLNEMVAFLESVQCGMKGKHDDVTDCADAIANIKMVSCCQCQLINLLFFCQLKLF